MSLALIAVSLPPATTTRAAGIVVSTTADAIDANGGACAGLTIASLPGPGGVTSLREAVCAANTTAGADAITFSVNGTFLLNKTGVDEDASNTGDLDITESLTITGNGQANTIIDGNATERILDTFGSAAITVAIGNVTLRNGRVDGTAFDSAAAVYVDNDDTVTITGSAVTGNTAVASGGAIENRGTLTITNSAFTNNQANGEGGAIRNLGHADHLRHDLHRQRRRLRRRALQQHADRHDGRAHRGHLHRQPRRGLAGRHAGLRRRRRDLQPDQRRPVGAPEHADRQHRGAQRRRRLLRR